MADDNESASKAAKKNKKRTEKRLQVKIDHRKNQVVDAMKLKDPIEILRDKLQEAKNSKDHVLAAKLRQQLWIEQDKAAGHKPAQETDAGGVDCDHNDLTDTLVTNPVTPPSPVAPENTSSLTPTEKRLRALNKKLQQIQTLKERRTKGEHLEQTQSTKIEAEQALLEEIEETRSLIGQMRL